ncbi:MULTISPECIES: hypothetical protein [Arthrobacter]|uniref:Uncharacterized protein n=2 Tax=Arthrobacter TaxID=1663 RepID=A0ABU9KQ22_9MICC|nr:hypothetical protein [Arthrobacter sp. YJM1]MDP5228646.1 hypothetical protein [Arthrobacter sp. YJM1]
MGSYSERLNVTCSAGNIPAVVSYDGRDYRVCEIPSRSYPSPSQPSGSVPQDYEIWRLRLVRDLTGQELTLHLAHYTDPEQWRLLGDQETPAQLLGRAERLPPNVLPADLSRSA